MAQAGEGGNGWLVGRLEEGRVPNFWQARQAARDLTPAVQPGSEREAAATQTR
jgi:hypothetical protein